MDAVIARKFLCERMSEISQRCWSAEWLLGTEYHLWQAVVEGPYMWGQNMISQEDVDTLKMLSEISGGWIARLGEEIFVPAERWEKAYDIWAKTQRRGKTKK
jgi:hypothetical protein